MIKKIRDMRNEEGFSLIELVVAVGILLVLTVGGILAYNGITDNARQAAVDNAASEVLTGAIAYDSTSGKEYTDAEDEWMSSATNDSITVKANKDTNGEICVIAENTEHGLTANKGAGVGCEGSTGAPGGGEETTPPVVETFRGNINVSTSGMDGMLETYISATGNLPEGSTVKVKATSYYPGDFWFAEDFMNTTNLTLTEDNSAAGTNEYGGPEYNVDQTYTVNSTGSFGYSYNISSAEYVGGSVFVEIQLPDGYTLDDGSDRVVYNQIPEIEEW